MANKLKVYKIEDQNTGQVYQIEGPEDATDDELFGALNQHLGGREPSPSPETPVAPAVPKSPVAAPRGQVTVGQGQGQADLPAAYTAPNMETAIGGYGAAAEAEKHKANWATPEEETQIAKMMADPNVPYDDLNKYVNDLAVSKGYVGSSVVGGPEPLQKYRDSIAKGQQKAAGGVTYRDWKSDLVKPQAEVQQKEMNDAPLLEKAQNFLTRGYQEAVQYGTPGWLARTYYDWTDIGKDKLRQRFPNATPDQIEAMQSDLIAWTQENLRAANQIETKDDPLVPWLAGQIIGSAGPEDLVPFVKGEKLATRTALAAGVNAAADAGYQGLDIAGGVQQEYNPLQTAAAAGIGGAFHLGMEGASAVAKAVTPEPRSLPEIEPTGENLGNYLSKQAEPKVTGTLRARNKELSGLRSDAVREANEHVGKVMEGWTNAPDFEVVSSWKDIKDPAVKAGLDEDARGAYTPDGKLLINLKNIDSPADLTAVVFHEALGHHGLAQRFDGQLDVLLDDIYDNGLASVQKKTDDWLARNPDEYKFKPDGTDFTPEERRRLATEEVLAEMSEKGVMPVTVKDKVTNLIKETARAAGVPLRISQREVDSILGMAHSATINGVKGDVRLNGFRYSKKVYHGTGATFNNKDEEHPYGAFDHDYMSSGEGAQVFGWGTYVTESRGIGENYRDKLGDTETTWNGVKAPIYNLRQVIPHEIRSKFGPEFEKFGIDPRAADRLADGFLEMRAGIYEKPVKDITVEKLLSYQEVPTSISDMPGFHDVTQKLVDHMDEKLKINKTGSLYEVQIPDGPYLHWDKTLNEMERSGVYLDEALDAAGLTVDSYDNWNYLEREYYHYRNKYSETLRSEQILEGHLGEIYTDPKAYVADVRKQNPAWAALSDKEILQEQEARLNRELDELAKQKKIYRDRKVAYQEDLKNIVHENMSGQQIYNVLSGKLGSPKKASEFLADHGIEGVEYPANSLSGRGMLKDDGTPIKNYVVFDDSSPKIVNKYSKKRTLQEETDYQEAVRRVADFWNIANVAKAEKERDFRAEVKMELAMAGKDQSLVEREPYAANDTRYSKKRTRERTDEDEIRSAREILQGALDSYEPTIRTWAEGRTEARLRGLTRKQINSAKGIGELDVRLHQYDAVAETYNNKLAELHAKMDNGTFSLADKHRYLTALAEYNDLIGTIFSNQAEVARALNVMKDLQYTKKKLSNLNELLADMHGSGMEAFADDTQFNKFAKAVQAAMAGGNQAGVNNLMTSVLKPYWWQYVLSFRHSMMLSGMATHAKNTVDNALIIARELEETALALPGFAVRKGIQKAGYNVKDGVSPQEIAGRLYGLMRAALDGDTYANTWAAFQSGHGNMIHSTKVQTSEARIPVLSKVQDALHASDTFFRAFQKNANLYTLGVREARKQGFTGVTAFEEGTNMAHNPTEEMLKEAANMTDVSLLIDTPSAFISRLEAMKAIRPNMKWEEQAASFIANLAFPFFRITDRLIYQKLRRSPLSILDRVTREDLAAGGARMDVAIARTLFGSALMYYYWNQAGQNKIVGAGPEDYNKSLALEAGGFQPNSIIKDGKYVDASALNISFLPSDLQNATAANIATIRKAWDEGKDAGDTAKAWSLASSALGAELVKQSFAENLATYIAPFEAKNEAMRDTAAANVTGAFLSSFIPAAVRQYNQMIGDPIKRDTTGDKSFSDRVEGRLMSAIPGLSEKLPIKYDVYGDEQPQGKTLFGMNNSKTIKTDGVSTELQRLEGTTKEAVVTGAPSSFEHEGETYKLPSDAKQEWQRVQGYYLKTYVAQEMKEPDYKTLSDAEKIERIKQARKDAYEDAKAYMLPLLGLEQ